MRASYGVSIVSSNLLWVKHGIYHISQTKIIVKQATNWVVLWFMFIFDKLYIDLICGISYFAVK